MQPQQQGQHTQAQQQQQGQQHTKQHQQQGWSFSDNQFSLDVMCRPPCGNKATGRTTHGAALCPHCFEVMFGQSNN